MSSDAFTGTRASALTSGECFGTYDKASNSVRLYVSFASANALTVDTSLFTIPSEYRPSANRGGAMIFQGANDTIGAGTIRVTSSGAIQQRASASATKGFGVIEYPLE